VIETSVKGEAPFRVRLRGPILRGALAAGEEKRLSEKPTQNLAAYDAFLKGEEASKGMALNDVPNVRRALGFYDQAVALDPDFALAWARVSGANSSLYYNSGPTPALAERALMAGEKAVALAPRRPEGYLALGTYERLVARNYNRALEQYAKGLRAAPGDSSLLRGTALAEEGLGRWDAAVEHFRQAERLDPRSVNNPSALGGALLYLRRYAEARGELDRGLALAPASLTMIEYKAMTFLGEGDLAGARAVFKAAASQGEPEALAAGVGPSGAYVQPTLPDAAHAMASIATAASAAALAACEWYFGKLVVMRLILAELRGLRRRAPGRAFSGLAISAAKWRIGIG